MNMIAREWRFILVMIILSTINYNAKEAHEHAHQLACAVKHEALCEYVDQKGASRD